MVFRDFRTLWQAAQTASDRDSFMDGHDQPEAPIIYDMAHGGMKAIRAHTGLSQKSFSAAYDLPRRTCEDWEAGARTPPGYLPILFAYAILSDVPYDEGGPVHESDH